MSPSPSVDERKRLLRRATAAAVITAFALAALKLFAWSQSGSIAALASAADSALDLGASLLNALAVRYAMKPADAEHRFGHGKSEALAGLFQALLISTSAVVILRGASVRFQHPEPVREPALGLLMMGTSLTATACLVLYQRHVVRRTGSTAVKADAFHYVTDLASNLATVAVFALAPLGLRQLDPLLGAAIALLTAYTALHVGWESLQVLLDRELPLTVRQRIVQLVLADSQVRGIHDLRTRSIGPAISIQFHLEVDAHMSVEASNHIARRLVLAIQREFPGADVIIHQDPALAQTASA